ncbi:MAG: hypothetical protein IKN39_03400, partial [Clostridia bacterium]|nr:hypothetical protein [Clostridia bacterium]
MADTNKDKALEQENAVPNEPIEDENDKKETIDDIENAPDDIEELFSEPTVLDIDFDEELSDEELKLEEVDVENLNDD